MAVIEEKRFNTPILLITFNRPDYVVQSLGEIRKQQPEKLYVFQDGPRVGNEKDLVRGTEVRKLVKNMVDWPCELHINCQEKNLGCGMGPYTAISWLFENEERGIIIEDDVVVHPLFFSYCDELLDKYSNDNRIGMIVGHNYRRLYSCSKSFYYTYRMSGTWGWATWRRVWKKFDFNIKYDYYDFDKALKSNYRMPRLYRDNEHKLYKGWLEADRHSYWDFQFDYYLLLNGYLNIMANSCLTSNVGTGSDATHEFVPNPRFLMDVNETLFNELEYPRKVVVDFNEMCRMYGRTVKLFIKKYL